ncbi:MAG: Bacterial antitoxin of ParD toxin-antitoxin type system [Pseudomonadota bacterium]
MPDSLPPDLKALIRAKVESGPWDSEEAVIRAALEALDERAMENWIAANEAEIRVLIQEGIDSGDAGEFIVEDIIAEGKRLLDAERSSLPPR